MRIIDSVFKLSCSVIFKLFLTDDRENFSSLIMLLSAHMKIIQCNR
jgi:cell fate regulator YaaT (PSP1 superfamily)